MDPVSVDVGLQLLLIGLKRMLEFGSEISAANNEKRDVNSAEVQKAGFTAQDHIDAVDASLKAAGG